MCTVIHATQSSTIDFFCVHVKSQFLNQTILLVDFYVDLWYKCSGGHSPLQEYLKLTISCQDRKVEKCNESPKKIQSQWELEMDDCNQICSHNCLFFGHVKEILQKNSCPFTLYSPLQNFAKLHFQFAKWEKGPGRQIEQIVSKLIWPIYQFPFGNVQDFAHSCACLEVVEVQNKHSRRGRDIKR